ncbi:thiamine ABC transporter substrate-binding protein [Halobacteriales archaeon QS_8_69_26]|nr:MAG: thiamine ABC transporter substrate-binding protein [Halobacteriales archaeon QS_8_69_26]
MERRDFLATTAALAGLGLAGCLSGTDGDDGGTTEDGNGGGTTTDGDGTVTGTTAESLEGTLTVATYDSFVDAPSTSPGPWIKEEFERRHPGVSLEWATPESGINYYIQRRNAAAGLDADAYVGLKVPELVRIDRETDEPLFEAVDEGALSNLDAVGDEYTFDPDGRLLPVFTGYASVVYDGTEVEEPETLDALTEPEYEGEVTVQNAQTDNTGLYFLLWTVKTFGADGYLDYWRDLLDNDVTVLQSWGEVYEAFTGGETSVVTSYSNDRVFAKRYDQDLEKHQVAFPGGNGYTNLSGMGKFATGENHDLAAAFVDFMLGPDAQGKLAERNVSFPVTDHATVPDVFEEYAEEPPDPLYFTYDELRGNVGTWREDWARVVAEK